MSDPQITLFGPDFPFAYDDWLAHPSGLGAVPEAAFGKRVAVIGAGISGLVCAFELMKMGLHPVVYEAGQLGGRLRSQPFEGAEGVVAELGGMRFPASSRCFWSYIDTLGLESADFPNPLTEAAGSTVIDIEGQTYYAETADDLPPIFQEVFAAWDAALEEGANFTALKAAIRAKDAARLREIWNPIVAAWDERSFYDFLSTSSAFRKLSFHHREVFGQVGFGTGGWDSDFPNSMLEILRVNATEQDDDQRYIVGGVEQVPQGIWRRVPERMVHWPEGTTLASLNGGATRPGVAGIVRGGEGAIRVTDRWGRGDEFDAVVATCQSWLLTTAIKTEEALFGTKLWQALDRTRYMQSSKTFVMVDRPFWKDRDPVTGRHRMSMTLTDRLTRGTYLFDNGPGKPGVICLSYSWMTDALKMLPLPVEKRVALALSSLEKIYPDVDITAHIVGDPITVNWEADDNFLGAFKGALPGHYRYNQRMFGQFVQKDMPPEQRGIFLAGDGVSWTPAWAEGAVQTGLNAVWGVMTHFGGTTPADNPGPGDVWDDLAPVSLPE